MAATPARTDPFTETRALRAAYREEHYPDLPIDAFNLGGPGYPARELGPELPEHCGGFLGSLLSLPEQTMVKETRFYDKLQAIRPLCADESVLIHVVRDPRAVAASMMMGRGRKRADAYKTPEAFFDEREKRKLWSSRDLSKLLLKRPEYSHIRRPANFMRILLLWKHTFESTYRDGHEQFGDRYVLLRNEELRADPVGGISRVYRAVGRRTPPLRRRVGARARSRIRRSPTRPTTRAGPRPSRRWGCGRPSLRPDTRGSPSRSGRPGRPVAWRG